MKDVLDLSWLPYWIVTLTCFGITWIPALGSKTPQPAAVASMHEQAPTQTSDHNTRITTSPALLRYRAPLKSTNNPHFYLTHLIFLRMYFWKMHLNCLELLKPISQWSKYTTSGQRESRTLKSILLPQVRRPRSLPQDSVSSSYWELSANVSKCACAQQQQLHTSKKEYQNTQNSFSYLDLNSNPVISAWLTLV